jgi:hypothetical protein
VKFLLDHDAPDDVAFSLEAMGHMVIRLREALPITAPVRMTPARPTGT